MSGPDPAETVARYRTVRRQTDRLCEPLAVDDVTPVTVGAVVSTVKLRVPLYDDPAADESTFLACQ